MQNGYDGRIVFGTPERHHDAMPLPQYALHVAGDTVGKIFIQWQRQYYVGKSVHLNFIMQLLYKDTTSRGQKQV